MTAHQATSKTAAPALWSAGLFALAYWMLDSGNSLWMGASSLSGALLPDGSQFASRLMFAAVFAVAGLIAGAALQRSRDVEEFALGRLQDSGRKYDALLASSFDSVITLDDAARIVELSQSAAALFNSDPANLVGRSIDELIETGNGNEALSRDLGRMPGSVVAGPGTALSVTVAGLQGRRFPAEVRVTPMPGNGSCAWVLAIRETTSTVVARKALQHSERRYHALFDNMLDGIFRSRPDGRFLAANPAMVRLLGYADQDELLADGNARNFYADLEQRNRLLQQLEQHGEARNVEISIRRRDGQVTTALANVRAVASENNEDRVYEGTLTDISDVLAARDALADSEEQFRTSFEHALDMIVVIDASAKIIYSSPSTARFAGRTQAEQAGSLLFKNAHPDDVDTIKAVIRQGFERPGTPQRFTCRIYDQHGELRQVEAVGTAFLTRHGQLRAIVNARDISDRVSTEAQLQEMQKIQVIGRLTNGVAHDFNNLLTVMNSNLEMLEDRIEDGPLRAHISSAMRACQQGCDLTRRLMAFADQQDISPESTSVNALIADLEPVLRRSLSHSIDIRLELADDLWDVVVDPARLEGALLQLAVNADDALKNEGRMTVSTANVPAENAVRITVSDTGSGMGTDVLARATEPFFSTREGTGHSGLGLSMAEKFAEAAGGRLEIESTPGVGTAVHLFLPRPRSGSAIQRPAHATPRGAERVLVVDDNVDVRNATGALLKSLGYEVLKAEGGSQALTLLSSESVDLLFTDLAMPQMNGIELSAKARSMQPNLKVLLTSGNEAATAEAQGGLNPNYELIRKPFRKQRLAEHVRHVLDT